MPKAAHLRLPIPHDNRLTSATTLLLQLLRVFFHSPKNRNNMLPPAYFGVTHQVLWNHTLLNTFCTENTASATTYRAFRRAYTGAYGSAAHKTMPHSVTLWHLDYPTHLSCSTCYEASPPPASRKQQFRLTVQTQTFLRPNLFRPSTLLFNNSSSRLLRYSSIIRQAASIVVRQVYMRTIQTCKGPSTMGTNLLTFNGPPFNKYSTNLPWKIQKGSTYFVFQFLITFLRFVYLALACLYATLSGPSTWLLNLCLSLRSYARNAAGFVGLSVLLYLPTQFSYSCT